MLLKTVRLYGAEHERTTALLGTAWDDLRAALKFSGEAGLLLGVSSGQVLLDGVPLEKRPTDRSFAQLLTSAGLASINFSQRVTVDDFWRFVRAFSSRSPKAGPLATELRAVLGGDKGAIRVNEVRFVAQDSSLGDAGLAAQLAARSLGADAQKLQGWLQDPQRLLQLIAAAEGARSQCAGPAASPGVPGVGGQATQEDDVFKVLRWLSQLGQTANQPASPEQISAVEKDLHQLPPPGQAALAQALMSLSAQNEPPRPDDPLLLQLAERVAVRFALERYEHGDVKTNAVVELLDRLKHEIGSLRHIVQAHEEKMGRAGMEVESHAEILDRQFWARVPERAKRKMLLSPEAWAVPPRNIRQFVEELLARGDADSARAILDNYAQCVYTSDMDARRKASTGLTEMADLFSRANHSLLKSTLHHMGEALGREGNADLQTLLGASFVRFSHEAAARRQYPAVHEALQAMEILEQRQPGLARILWPRVKVGNPLPEFIEEALRAPRLPEGLVEVLRRMPHATVDQVATRIHRCARRDEWERLLEMVEAVGPEAVAHLSKILQTRPAPEAASKIALLSRLGPKVLEELLPTRLREWDPMGHDLVVRQLANSLAPQRGKLLDQVYDLLDSSVLPEVVDELGMSGDLRTTPRLMRMVEKEFSHPGDPYLQIKAIEALGRLREAKAAALLRPLAEGKRFWRWKYPRELRITAVQALRKIDPEWAQRFVPKCGLSEAELNLTALDADPDTPWLRQRRYERLNLPRPLNGSVRPSQGYYTVSIQQLSLGGGVARSQVHIKPGRTVPLEFQSGMHRIHASVLVREARPQELTFELVRIGHEDRSHWRRPLVGLHSKEN
ncbi:MAG: HEAT repeat domain-containing protein [Terriglobia bacterium]